MNMFSIDKEFYTITQLSEVLGLTEPSIRSKIARNQIRTIKLGGRVLIPTSWVRELIKNAYNDSNYELGG